MITGFMKLSGCMYYSIVTVFTKIGNLEGATEADWLKRSSLARKTPGSKHSLCRDLGKFFLLIQ